MQEWFDELWEEAVDYDLAGLFEAGFEPQRKQPLFRYVGPGDEGTSIPDTLACLDRARPLQGFETPRTLDEQTYRQAFDA